MKGDLSLRSEILDFFRIQAPIMGSIALKYFHNMDESQIQKKIGHDNDPVTIADIEISDYITSEVKQEFGEQMLLLTEESANNFSFNKNQLLAMKKPIMVVDELDGTRNFSTGKEDFSILLGLAEYVDGKYEMTTGLVYKPLSNEFFFATIESDAVHVTGDGLEQVLQVSNSDRMIVGKTSVNVGVGRSTFPTNHLSDYLLIVELFESFREANQVQVRKNNKFSAGLEIMDLANGQVDVYLCAKAANWDYAAASLILKQAGGKSYLVRNADQIITPEPWSLQLDAPDKYYPTLFTNGSIDKDFFQHIKLYMETK